MLRLMLPSQDALYHPPQGYIKNFLLRSQQFLAIIGSEMFLAFGMLLRVVSIMLARQIYNEIPPYDRGCGGDVAPSSDRSDPSYPLLQILQTR